LAPLAAQFKAGAGGNRIAEAETIVALLPVCPEHRGTLLAFGEDEYTDWNDPSYRLPKEQFLQMMGQPNHQGTLRLAGLWVFASYNLGRDRRNNETRLYIQFYKDYVVGGYVAETNTVQSVSTRTHPDGSITVTTNYIQ
jgi:hypothetical protein